MSSLTSLVAAEGALQRGEQGPAVLALQVALQAAGYRATADGDFGPATEYWVQQVQQQHGLRADGVVGPLTAAVLDAPHAALVATAKPLVAASSWPHDDTASLLAFYGKPWGDSSLLVQVPVPYAMTYSGTPVHTVRFHSRGAAALGAALGAVAALAEDDPSVLRHVGKFSGSYNYRPVRGSSRLSCHAFGAAVDFDADSLPLGHDVPSAEMPQAVVDAFKAQGFFWGGDYRGRKDPMHFQLAHE